MTTDPTSEQLAALVRDFLDPDPCALDHHGYCQTHSWLCEGRCPHARAREVLAEYDAEQAASAGAAPADEPAPAGLGVSDTPSHTDLRERLRRALGINPPAEETHVVADDSDDPERIDGMRRRAAAAVPAVPTTTKDGAQ